METNGYWRLKKGDLCKGSFYSKRFIFLRCPYTSLYNTIYLSEVQFKKENISNSEASFLDLSMVIENKKFKTQLSDKRDAFPFYIFCMSHLDTNIP